MKERTGKCLCGAVTVTATIPDEAHACHCRMCQRWTGSALVSVEAAADAVSFGGEENIATHASSAWAERGFCKVCGSGLFYRVTAPGPHQGKHYFPVAIFDDTDGMKLVGEIFYDCRHGVFEYAGDTHKKTQAEVMAEFGG